MVGVIFFQLYNFYYVSYFIGASQFLHISLVLFVIVMSSGTKRGKIIHSEANESYIECCGREKNDKCLAKL